jgi:hypothetical protein
MDGGACMHLALNKCVPGVLTIQELDHEIKEVHAEKNQKPQWAPDRYKLEWCGTPGQSWHQDCILGALKRKYPGRFTWRRHPPSVVFKRGKGKFYVHGVLNSSLFPELDQQGNWQHSICVDTDTGRFYDQSCDGYYVRDWLTPKVRYMSQIWRVYQLTLQP